MLVLRCSACTAVRSGHRPHSAPSSAHVTGPHSQPHAPGITGCRSPALLLVQITGVVGYLVGRRGATIRDIQRANHVRVSLQEGESATATVEGAEEENVARAAAKIRDIVAAARASPRPVPAFRAQIELQKGQAGALIGEKGATVQKLRADTGATVSVSRRGRVEYAVIEATSQDAGQAAEAQVRRIIASATESRPSAGGAGGGERRATAAAKAAASHAHSKAFMLPDVSLTAVVLGVRGSTIRALESETGATIVVDKDNEGRIVVSGGSASLVDAAIDRIRAHIAGFKRCGTGASCLGWAVQGKAFCPRCNRLKETGEAADAEVRNDSRARTQQRRHREKAVSAARSAKQGL